MKNAMKKKEGFTLVEVLMSLAISAMLMVALAGAFSASAVNYRENRDIYNTINNGRQALCRMTAELRTGYDVDPNDPNTQCIFKVADGTETTYQYHADDRTLYLVKAGVSYTLCENVSHLVFTKTPTAAGDDCSSVQILLQVQCGNVRQDLAAAAVIRRNL